MYGKILIPVDVNQLDKADAMLETARKLGSDKSEIILVHIIETVPAYIAVQIPAEYTDKAKAEAHAALTKLSEQAGGASQIDIRSGHPAEAILAIANEKDVDTIIIASHRPGFEDYFLGSTAARVVRHAQCSVIVIR